MDPFYMCLLAAGLIMHIALCVRSPAWGLVVIFAAAPFPYDLGLGSVKVSTAELLTLMNVVILIFSHGLKLRGPVFSGVLLYLLTCALSSIMHWRDSAPVVFFQMVLYLVIAVHAGVRIPRQPSDIAAAFDGLVAAGLFLGTSVLLTGSMYLFGLHKNSIGGSLSVIFLAAALLWERERRRLKRWYYLWGMIVSLGGMLVVASRGAWLGTIVAMFTVFIFQRRFRFALRMGLAAIVLIPLLWTLVPDRTKEYALDLSSHATNVQDRLKSIDLAKRYFEEDVIFGSGVGLRKDYDATNLVMVLLAETGILGLTSFMLLVVMVFLSFRKSLRQVRGCPIQWTALVGICLAIFTSQIVHGLVDHYWSRGVLVISWIVVGMSWSLGRMARGYLVEADVFDSTPTTPTASAA